MLSGCRGGGGAWRSGGGGEEQRLGGGEPGRRGEPFIGGVSKLSMQQQ